MCPEITSFAREIVSDNYPGALRLGSSLRRYRILKSVFEKELDFINSISDTDVITQFQQLIGGEKNDVTTRGGAKAGTLAARG